MSSLGISTGSYLSALLSQPNSISSVEVTNEPAQSDVVATSDLSIDFSTTGYLLLRDTVDEWSSMVSMVQVSDADLQTLANYLSQIRDKYEILSGTDVGTDFEVVRGEIRSIETQMSSFLGQRSVLTPDVSIAFSQEGSFQQRYFESLNLSSVDSSFGDFSLGVIEVDMGQVLLSSHDPSKCPICSSASSELDLYDSLPDTSTASSSNDEIAAYDAAATNVSNVTGGALSNTSGVSYIEPLRMGPIWDLTVGETLSYSYYSDPSVVYTGYPAGGRNPPSAGLESLIPTHEVNLDLAYAAWDLALEFDFEKITETGISVGELRNAYTTVAPAGVAAYAYNPGSTVVNGDVWFVKSVSTNLDFTPGGYGFMTALHEIGHAIGLSHPFDGGSDTGATLPAAQDIMRNTFMSYTSRDRNFYLYNTGNSVSMQGLYASTPMVYDVATVEFLYGEVTDANLGNTNYSWADTPLIIETIVDSGGVDTIDASNQTKKSRIDLTPGAYSSIGIWTQAEQVAYFSSQTGISAAALNNYIATQSATVTAASGSILYTGEDNLGIAFSANIENAIGGQGDDEIIGNSLDNELTGNSGNDIISGNAGTDTVIFNGNFADYGISVVGGTITVVDNAGNDGTDILTTVEFLKFADLTYDVSTGSTSTTGGGSSNGGGFNGAVGWRLAHGLQSGSVRTAKEATMLIGVVDVAIENVSKQRSALGAILNVLDRRADVLVNSRLNSEKSRSLIMDTNYAVETVALAKQLIIQSAGREMLRITQTNPTEVLSLLS